MIIKNLQIVKGLLKKEMKKKNAESCTTTVFSKYLSDFGKSSMFFGGFFLLCINYSVRICRDQVCQLLSGSVPLGLRPFKVYQFT